MIKIRNLIRQITKNSDDYDYDEKYMKIKLNSDDELPLNETVEILTITIVRDIFLENKKYYPRAFWDECVYKKWIKSKNKAKKVHIKSRVFYYFDNIIWYNMILIIIRQKIIWKYFSL